MIHAAAVDIIKLLHMLLFSKLETALILTASGCLRIMRENTGAVLVAHSASGGVDLDVHVVGRCLRYEIVWHWQLILIKLVEVVHTAAIDWVHLMEILLIKVLLIGSVRVRV